MGRRDVVAGVPLTGVLAGFTAAAAAGPATVREACAAGETMGAYDFEVTLDGEPVSLAKYKGKVSLIMNIGAYSRLCSRDDCVTVYVYVRSCNR